MVVNLLSAFTAQPIVELKQRDKSKIESLLTYGTKDGEGAGSGTDIYWNHR